MMRPLVTSLLLALVALTAPMAGLAAAQDGEEAERSRFVRFIEDTISSPNMRIGLIGLDGALSRDVSLERITVSDADGVWLTIEEPRLRWNRAALLRRALVIERLSARSLAFTRPPRAGGGPLAPEARRLALPELPVSVRIDRLDLPRAAFGEPVFGLASTLSVEGGLLLDAGRLDARLDIVRLDGAGGRLALDADLADGMLDVDVRLREPADGVLANLIDIPGRPPVGLALAGGGPLDALDIALAFDVDGARILDGTVTTSRPPPGGTRARFDLQGPLADILPARERAFFGARTELRGALLFGGDGTVIERIALESGALSADISGRLLPDGFPESLAVRAALTAAEGAGVDLPGATPTTIGGAEIALDYGGSDWRLTAVLDRLRATGLTVARITVDGSGTVSDPRDPETRAIAFDIAARAQGHAPADPGLAAAIGPQPRATVRGGWRAGGPVAVDALTLSIGEGGRVTLAGLAGADRLDLDARLAGLTLAMADAFRPGLGASGSLGGTAKVTGTPRAPRVAFDLHAVAVTAAALREAGVAPFSAAADGAFEAGRLRLARASASNAQGLDLTASGAIPLSGPGLDVGLSGSAPLALAEAALAGRGIGLAGVARFEGRATGTAAAPSLTGLISVAGGRIADPRANVELTGVNVLAGLEGDRLVLRNASARLGGGALAMRGRIGLAAPFPADLAVELAGVRYTDGRMVTADLGADLSITGPLAGGALVAGQVDLARAEIAVPDGFGADPDLIDVRHADPGAGTLATLRRIEAIMGDGGGSGGPRAPFRLDLDIAAPGRMFVRGRGLDVELGGRLGLTGTLDAIVPTGGFELIGGRLSILERRIDFTGGRLTLAGDLDPFVDLTAEASAGDLPVALRLAGPASNLALELSSSPPLPEDQIFARLLFGNDIASLSPLQITRLAGAAASLAGGGSGLTGGLGGALGVDDLDIVEDADGGIGVRAGRHLADNVYLELEAGGGGTRTTINLDITDSLTARGSADTDADSTIGIFFERDY